LYVKKKQGAIKMVQLVNKLERATIWIAGQQMRLEGIVSRWDGTGVGIRMPEVPGVANILKPGTIVTLTLYSPGGTKQVQASVHDIREGECVFRFDEESLQPLGRRRRARYPCQMPVRFRAINNGEPDPTWYNATAVEIGTSGMRLITNSTLSIPGKMEVEFTPAGYDVQVRVFGRVAHCKVQESGTFVFGVAIEEIPRMDQTWIERLFR
jgi:hypothetical protein